MKTDELIAALSHELEPVPAGFVTRSLAIGALGGTLAAAIFWMSMKGARPDLAQAVTSWPFWMKFFYTLALALVGYRVLARAGRPGATMMAPVLLLVAPFAVLAVIAAIAMSAPDADMNALLMGHSARHCSTNIVLVSLPVMVGAFWSLRRLAPTRLTLAGAAAGLFAGSAGAFVYAFHCTESAAPFVAIWYSVGIAAATLIGALLGRIALRW